LQFVIKSTTLPFTGAGMLNNLWQDITTHQLAYGGLLIVFEFWIFAKNIRNRNKRIRDEKILKSLESLNTSMSQLLKRAGRVSYVGRRYNRM
jgi:hypothetical protein